MNCRNHRQPSHNSGIILAESFQGHLTSGNHSPSTSQPYTNVHPLTWHTQSVRSAIPPCITMAFQSHNLSRLALDCPTHHSTTSPHHPHQQRPRRLPSRRDRTWSQSRPKLLPHHLSSSSLERVTDAMTTHNRWSGFSCTKVPPTPMRGQLAVGDGEHQGNITLTDELVPENPISPGHVPWPVEDQANALPSPPQTPRPTRLRTPDLPELEHARDSGRFCSCCVRTDLKYQEDRAKMDSQREYFHPFRPSRLTLVRLK